MNSSSGRLALNTAVMAVNALLTLILNVLISREMLRLFGIDDFGLLSLITSFVAMMDVANTSMAAAMQRFFSTELGKGDASKLSRTFAAAVRVQVGLALLVLLIGELVGPFGISRFLVIPADRIAAAHWIFQLSLLGLTAGVVAMPYRALLTARERMYLFSTVDFVFTGARLLILLLLPFYHGNRLIVFAAFLMSVNILSLIYYRGYCRSRFAETVFNGDSLSGLYKKLGSFAGWNMLGSIVDLFRLQGANLVLNFFFSLAVNSAYAISLQVNNAVTQFSAILSTAATPQIIKRYAAGETDAAVRLAWFTIKFCFAVQIILAAPLFLEMRTILSLWLTESKVPDYAPIFCVLTLVINAINVTASPMVALVNATGKNRLFQSVHSFFVGLNIPVSCLLLSIWPKPWLLMAVNVVIALTNVQVRVFLVRRLIPFSVFRFYWNVLLPLLAGTAPIFLFWFLSRQYTGPAAIRILTDLFAAPIVTALWLYFILFTPQERQDACKRLRQWKGAFLSRFGKKS